MAHVCRASRKDARDAVTSARGGLAKWKGSSAYLRGQVMYRIAEMLEARREEFAGLLGGTDRREREREVTASVDRLMTYAGWADKFAQVLGCNNSVNGPYYNFTVPESTGVVAVLAPDQPGLLGLVSGIAPTIVSGNACVVISGMSNAAQLAAAVFGEVIATSDVPAGVVNILTAQRSELVPVIASHRDIDGVFALGLPAQDVAGLRAGSAENLKRVVIREVMSVLPRSNRRRAAEPSRAGSDRVDLFDNVACATPWWIEPMIEMKTIWHPSSSM
jgi:acyl-CoA reductase-like NAD-dependent aldehyde dehydrogenase